MRQCPACNLINPDSQTVCDCGLDLVHGSAELERRRRYRTGLALMGGGVLGVLFMVAIFRAVWELGYVVYGVGVLAVFVAALSAIWRGWVMVWRTRDAAAASRRSR